MTASLSAAGRRLAAQLAKHTSIRSEQQKQQRHELRSMVDTLEARTFLSASPAGASSAAALLNSSTPGISQQLNTELTAALNAAAKQAAPTSVLPLTISNVAVQNGQLVAQGLLGRTPFTAPITASASPNQAMPDCPILNLHLGPIHLDVLGLVVDTSQICLDITATHGQLLGDLLCSVSNLLNQGTPLGTILGGLTSTQLSTLTNGLTSILNGVLGNLLSTSNITGIGGQHVNGACNILNLSLGPVDLNLLGLNVHLDNCNNGPVTVDITAVPGPGNLLGNLLCGIVHALDNSAAQGNILDNVLRIINRRLG